MRKVWKPEQSMPPDCHRRRAISAFEIGFPIAPGPEEAKDRDRVLVDGERNGQPAFKPCDTEPWADIVAQGPALGSKIEAAEPCFDAVKIPGRDLW
jgi:hypothetical protein